MVEAAALPASLPAANTSTATRRHHGEVSPEALPSDPEPLARSTAAALTDFGLAGFPSGDWVHPLEEFPGWRRLIKSRGMSAYPINVPLGHPGNLGEPSRLATSG